MVPKLFMCVSPESQHSSNGDGLTPTQYWRHRLHRWGCLVRHLRREPGLGLLLPRPYSGQGRSRPERFSRREDRDR